jgi:hypothetical protein
MNFDVFLWKKLDYATPQVWLIKRNGNVSHNEEDGCTQLLFNDNFDGQTLSTITDITNGTTNSLLFPISKYFWIAIIFSKQNPI